MDTLYIIELQDGKFYVGKTKNFVHRMDQHLEGDGAYWCKTYGPMKSCSKVCDFVDATHEETKKTLELMVEKGINNVRGAEYCQLAPFTAADCRRMSYAAIHHLKRTDREHIENCFERNCASNPPMVASMQNSVSSATKQVYNFNNETPSMKRARTLPTESVSSFPSKSPPSAYHASAAPSTALQAILEAKRTELSERTRMMPYMIFSNQTLEELCGIKPTTTEALLDIHGIGPVKLEQFGGQLLQIINDHLGNPSCVDCHTAVAPSKPRCLTCYRKMQKK